MTIEQANQMAIEASNTDDVAGIRRALEARREAIRELAGAEPSPALAARLSAAIEAGDEVRRALVAIKYRAGRENARLTQLHIGLVAGGACLRHPKVDCRG